jgi:predicted RNA-binding Zn ribbon-like protein
MENKYTGFLKGRREMYENREKCPPDGDVPVLQFVNTLHRRATDRKDYLKNYDCFLDWAYDAGIVEDAVYNTLAFESYSYWPEAEIIFERVKSFRECFRDLVICLMEGIAPYPQLVNNFNMYFEEVKQHLSLNMNGYGMYEIWVDTHEQIAFPLWRLIKDARDFLMTTDGQFIKKCNCGNLFIDRSKNGKRRWCNRATCGSMHWSKVYYRKMKGVVEEDAI